MLDKRLDTIERHYIPATLIVLTVLVVVVVAVFASLATAGGY